MKKETDTHTRAHTHTRARARVLSISLTLTVCCLCNFLFVGGWWWLNQLVSADTDITGRLSIDAELYQREDDSKWCCKVVYVGAALHPPSQ